MSVKSNSDADDVFVVWALDETWQMGEAKWVEGRVFIEESHQEKEYSVVITTKKGSNDQSYVAFDQVAFIQTENCELKPPEAMPITTTTMAPTPPTTTPPKQWHECNFEKEDLCGWQVFPSPPDFPFQWERTNGKLLADNSVEGPQHDHDEQNQSKFTSNQNVSLYLIFVIFSGYFMFASAAYDHSESEEAVMASPKINNPDFCFNFWFFVKPHEGIKELQITMENANAEHQVILWQLTEFKLDFWEQGRVHVANPEEFTLLIKAIRTDKKDGFAAFDDAFVINNDNCEIFPDYAKPPEPTTTPAPPQTECEFENGLCDWTPGGGVFKFNRTNAQGLIDSGVEGPQVDHTDSKESKF